MEKGRQLPVQEKSALKNGLYTARIMEGRDIKLLQDFYGIYSDYPKDKHS